MDWVARHPAWHLWEGAEGSGKIAGERNPYGAEWLFDRWPFRKIRSFQIGAIEIPLRKDALIPFALSLMDEPFEVTGKTANRLRRSLYQSFADLV